MKKVILLLLCLCIVLISATAYSEASLRINKAVINFDKRIGGTFYFKVSGPSLKHPVYATVVVDSLYGTGSYVIDNLPFGTYTIEEIGGNDIFAILSPSRVIKKVVKKEENVNFIGILRWN